MSDAFAAACSRIAAADTEPAVHRATAVAAEELFDADGCTIALPAEGADGDDPAAVRRVPFGRGVLGQVRRTGRACVVDDRGATRGDAAPEHRSLLAAPIDEAGVLVLTAAEPGAFSEADRERAGRLAAAAADALDRVAAPARVDGGRDPLEEVATIISHDLQNALAVARGYLDLAREADDEGAIERALDAVERADEIADGAVALARTGERVSSTAPVDLAAVAERGWSSVADADATLAVVDDAAIMADERSLVRLLENLFRNAVEHGFTSSRAPSDDDHGSTGNQASSDDSVEDGAPDDGGVTVSVGTLPDGFYVADDGPGIPEGERERVFDRGYSGAGGHHGVGLAMVRRLAEAHGWSVAATASAAGGARIEITGVTFADGEDNV